MMLYGLTSDRYIKYCKVRDGELKPERRLLHMVLGLATFPVGMFLYAWTIQPAIHWIVPLIGTAIVGFSMLLTILPTENYLVDSFDEHGASAVAAGVILRAIFGALLPLVGPPLYQNLGAGWGNSVLGFIGAAFLPPVVLLWRRGGRMRKKEGLV
jgi:MFS family permease